jgi:predicted esterase
MVYDFIHYPPLTQDITGHTQPKLVILLHGYAVNGFVMSKMAHIIQDTMPQIEVMSLNADEQAAHPRKRVVPKTLYMPPKLMNDDNTLTEAGQRQWFSVYGAFPTWGPRLYHAALKMKRFIEAEAKQRGIALSDIALCGFSQGGALALYTSLIMSKPLGAVIAHSAPFLGFSKNITATSPSLFIYGCPDTSIADHYFERSVEELSKINREAVFIELEGLGHRMSSESCQITADFITEHLFKTPN